MDNNLDNFRGLLAKKYICIYKNKAVFLLFYYIYILLLPFNSS